MKMRPFIVFVKNSSKLFFKTLKQKEEFEGGQKEIGKRNIRICGRLPFSNSAKGAKAAVVARLHGAQVFY